MKSEHEINPQDIHELKNWAKQFGVPIDRLRKIISKVGTSPRRIQHYLKNGRESDQFGHGHRGSAA